MDPFTNEPYSFQETRIDPREAEFNNGIREITIIALSSILFYAASYAILKILRRKESEEEEFLPTSWEDAIVYQISFCICAFALAVSVGSALLLPTSSIANEVLHRYPSSWYIQWLNASLIHGLWNWIFVLSNFALFLCLPFAYLFCESEGLPFLGTRRGLVARAKETIITLLLLSLVILGIMYVVAALIDRDRNSIDRIFHIFSYLPFLYSCVSFLGVLMLLLCTPLGFARLFTVVGDLVIKPNFTRNLDEEYFAATFEENSFKQKLSDYAIDKTQSLTPSSLGPGKRVLRNGEVLVYYQQQLAEATARRQALEVSRKSSSWKRMLGYPLILLVLVTLTSISLICVINNLGQIMAGFKSVPHNQQTFDLGLTSLSSLGVVGVVIEVILIFYLFVTSLVGLYTIPIVKQIRPSLHDTSLTHLILNSGLGVILSSALPLLAKILGITNFDLLGSFGEVKWLNFYVVLLYNSVFAVAASLCLFNKFTVRVRQEIFRRVVLFITSSLGFTSGGTSNSSASKLSSLIPHMKTAASMHVKQE